MTYSAITPEDLTWITRPHEAGEAARHVAELSELAGFAHLGEPPQREEVPSGGLIHVAPGTPLQTVNHGDDDLLVYAYGYPPEDEHAEILESAVSES